MISYTIVIKILQIFLINYDYNMIYTFNKTDSCIKIMLNTKKLKSFHIL